MNREPQLFTFLAALSMLLVAVGPEKIGSIDLDNVFLFVAGMFAGLAAPRPWRTEKSKR